MDRVLVYMDGPQLMTLKGSRNSNWIAVAVDVDGMEYPFFCSQISSDELSRYFDGHVDLRFLFLYSKYKQHMLFEYEGYAGEAYMSSVTCTEDLLPEEGFFARDHTEVVGVRQESPSPSATSDDAYKVDIDGSWEFPEFASFSERMSGVYSFIHSLNTLADNNSRPDGRTSRLKETFSAHPWRGGFSYVNFYDDLYVAIPKVDRLNVREISYASPGHITLEGSKETFAGIEVAVKAMRENFSSTRSYYSDLYYYLGKRKLLSSASDTVRGTLEVQQNISKALERLANTIGLSHIDIIHEASKENWVVTAKIVLSYHRRLSELFKFYAEGRARTNS